MLKLAPLQVSTSPPSNRRAYPLHTSQSSLLLICMRGLDRNRKPRNGKVLLHPGLRCIKGEFSFTGYMQQVDG